MTSSVYWPSDSAIALIKEAGLPVRLSFKRAPVSVKGLFGTVAGPSSEAGGTAATTMPSFNFGVTQRASSAGSTDSTAAGGVKFGSGGTAAASTSSPSFSFGVTKTETTTADNSDNPGDGEAGADDAPAAPDEDGDGDAKE